MDVIQIGGKYVAFLWSESLSHSQRLSIASEIAEHMKHRFHPDLLAIGLYGSLAREQDGLYSDIEIFGVLQTDHYTQRYEWCTAEWKEEVDLYGQQTLRDLAERVDERWPLTHGAFQTVLPLDDPEHFLQNCAPSSRNANNTSRSGTEACSSCYYGNWISKPAMFYHRNQCHL